MILSCSKTGRYWRVQSVGAAYAAARHLGLTQFEIEGADDAEHAPTRERRGVPRVLPASREGTR